MIPSPSVSRMAATPFELMVVPLAAAQSGSSKLANPSASSFPAGSEVKQEKEVVLGTVTLNGSTSSNPKLGALKSEITTVPSTATL